MGTLMIGANLARLRTACGKNQQEVAKACHITRQALSNYELGKRIPDMDILLLLAEYYKVPVDDLLRG